MSKKQDWFDFLKKVTGWIMGVIAFVTAVVGFVKLWQGDSSLVTIMLLAVGVGGGWLGCAYLTFKTRRIKSPLPGGKETLQYSPWRPWALAGLVIISLLAIILPVAKPRIFTSVKPVFVGTSTPTPTLTITSTPTNTPTSTPTVTPTAIPINTPTTTPTPTPIIRPAVEGEILIIVSTLDGPENLDFDPQPRIYTGLESAINDVVGIDIRLGRCDQIITSQAEANSIREQFAATLVVWGFYDSKGITLRYTTSPETAVLDSSTLQPEDVAAAEIGQAAYDLYVGKEVSSDAAFVGLFTLAQALQASRRYEEAIEAYTLAIDKVPSSPLPGRSDFLIVTYVQRGVINDDFLGQPEAARADYLAAIQLEPETDSAIPYRYRGVAHRQLGNVEMAEDDARTAISRDANYAHPHLDLAILDYRSEEYDEAADHISDALTIDPQFAIAHYYNGILSYVTCDPSGARENFSQAIESDPNLYVAYYFRAIVACDKGDYEQAFNDLAIAIEGLPNFGRPMLIRGMILTDLGKANPAIEDLTSVIERFPDLQQEAHFLRGLAYLQLEDFEAAADDFTQALESNVQPGRSLFNRGLAYFRLGDYDAALRDFNDVIQKDEWEEETVTSAYYFRGLIYETQGDNVLALNDFSRAIEREDPPNAASYYHRGLNYFIQGDNLQQAELDFLEAIRIDPEIVPAYHYLGQIAMRKEELEMAELYFNQALDLLPDYPAAWLGLTDLYLVKGDRENAQEAYQEYKKHGGKPVPDYEEIATP